MCSSQGCSYFVNRIHMHVCVCVHIFNNISYTIFRIVYVLSSSFACSQQEVSYLSMSKWKLIGVHHLALGLLFSILQKIVSNSCIFLEDVLPHIISEFCINLLMPNYDYSGRTAPLTSKCCILYIYSTNIGTEYFKHCIYSPFFPLQNAVCFINLTYLVPVLFTFYIQGVIKLKK